MSEQKMKMPVKVQIMTSGVDHRSGEKDGKAWEINEQEAWVTLPSKPFPVNMSLRLPSQNAAYAEGDYVVDIADCLGTDRFGKLAIDDRKIKLKPLAKSAEQKTA